MEEQYRCNEAYEYMWRVVITRKEGNDQESIQLPNTFRSKTPTGKMDALKATAKKKKKKKKIEKNKKYTKTYMQRTTVTEIIKHSRSTALEQSVKILLRA